MSQKMSDHDHTGHFEDFLLTEYNNIAQAYFNTKNTISTFFKHYIFIISLPIPFILFLMRNGFGDEKTIVNNFRQLFNVYFPWICLFVFVLGLCVVVYIFNLHFSSVLYARTVNGIRKYFYANHSCNDIKGVRVMPIDINKPKLSGFHLFLVVVFSSAAINSLYFVFFLKGMQVVTNIISLSVIYLLILVLHFLLYFHLGMIENKKIKNFLGSARNSASGCKK